MNERLQSLAEQGLSQRAIARITGLSRFVVARQLRPALRAAAAEAQRLARETNEEDPPPAFAGPHRRCPGCGGKVQFPCLACAVRRRIGGSAASGLGAAALAAILFWSSPSLAASHRTENFLVHADDVSTAHAVATASETWRDRLAREWLGHELAPWPTPCVVTAVVDDSAGGGATSFLFSSSGPPAMQGQWQGRRDRLLADVTPHEVLHTVLATHFRRPLPRWIDEGACSTVESDLSRDRLAKACVRHLLSGRGIAFRQLFAFTDYPADIEAFYAQSHLVTTFLIRCHEPNAAPAEEETAAGRRKLLVFAEMGAGGGDWAAAAQACYGFRSLSELQQAWVNWVRVRIAAPLGWCSDGARPLCRPAADGSIACPPAAPATPSPTPGLLSAPGAAVSSSPAPSTATSSPAAPSSPPAERELTALVRELLHDLRASRRPSAEPRRDSAETPRAEADAAPMGKTSARGDPWWLDLAPYAAAALAGAFGFGIPWYAAAAWKGLKLARRWRNRARAEAAPVESEEASARRRDDFRASPGVFDRDLGEAQEYLRLAASEGHAPLQDALVGRIAQEELEQLVDGDDPALAQLAANLRARIRERVDRLAPVS